MANEAPTRMRPAPRWPGLTARAAGAVVALGALAVLIGWIEGHERLSGLTATGFCVLGVALWFAAADKGNRRNRVIVVAGAGVVALTGLMRLGDFAFGGNLNGHGIDGGPSGNFSTGQMSPFTALSLALLALSLVLAGVRRFPVAWQILAGVGGIAGALVIGRYIYGGEPLLPREQMAAPAAVACLILSVGVLCLRPDRGICGLLLAEGTAGLMMRRLLPAAVIIPLVVGWVRLKAQAAGWLGMEAGVTLFALVNMVLFGAFVWATAASLQRSDQAKRQAERSEQESQQLLGSIIDSSVAAIYVKDLAGRYLLVNRCFEESFRVDRAQVLGRTDHDLFPAAAADAFRAVDERVIASGTALTEEEVAPHHSGPHTYVSVKCPLRDADGNIRGVFGVSTDITERKQAEEAVRRSEEQYRRLFETLIEGFCTIEVIFDQASRAVDYRFLEVNPAFAAQTGLNDARGRFMRELVPAHEEHWFQIYGEIALTGEPRRFENEARALGRFYDVCAYRVGDAESRRVAILFNDITERKRAETALRVSEVRLRTLAESLPHLVWTCRADGYCDYLSPQWVAYTGRPEAEQLGSGWAEFLHPEDRSGVERAWSEATRRGDQFDVEFRIRRHDGQYRWFKTRAVPLRDGAGQIVKWFGSNTDFEEHKQAEARVQAQLGRVDLLNRITRAIAERQDLPSIFQVVAGSVEASMPVDFCCLCRYEPPATAIVVSSVGGSSAALAAELGMTEQARIDIDQNGLSRAVQGRVVYEPDVTRIEFPFAQRLARGGLRGLVIAPLLVESKVFGLVIAARRQPQSFSSGECEFLRQLSEQVALASHQAELHGALQQAYDDLRRTQQAILQQERLRALGQMASGIAHDINNAISPVTLYTESLLEKEPNLSPKARSYLTTIQHAIGDVAQTVSRMREFYRQREVQLTLAPVDLNAVAGQVAELTRARWSDMPQQRGVVIDFQSRLAAGLPAIMAVESEIREALINLVFNAVDAMPDGGTLTLRTEARHADPESPRVEVHVKDTGVGMSEDVRRRCLEPFFTTKGERGTGLGLAMVYGIVRRHSANLEIKREPGRGTTVSLDFAAADPVWHPPTVVTERRPPAGMKVLLIDDDPQLIKSLRDTLEADGHEIGAAAGGQEGIAAFLAAQKAGKPFAAVITDLGMPHVDGRQVASAIKHASPGTPVIMLTGWGQRLIAEGDVPPHVDQVLSKPAKLRDLREALARAASS